MGGAGASAPRAPLPASRPSRQALVQLLWGRLAQTRAQPTVQRAARGAASAVTMRADVAGGMPSLPFAAAAAAQRPLAAVQLRPYQLRLSLPPRQRLQHLWLSRL